MYSSLAKTLHSSSLLRLNHPSTVCVVDLSVSLVDTSSSCPRRSSLSGSEGRKTLTFKRASEGEHGALSTPSLSLSVLPPLALASFPFLVVLYLPCQPSLLPPSPLSFFYCLFVFPRRVKLYRRFFAIPRDDSLFTRHSIIVYRARIFSECIECTRGEHEEARGP